MANNSISSHNRMILDENANFTNKCNVRGTPEKNNNMVLSRGLMFKDSLTYSPEAAVASYALRDKASSMMQPKAERQLASECAFCNRKPQMMICCSCGYVCEGRVRTCCPVHPEIIHLMDTECCASCNSTHLQEFPKI